MSFATWTTELEDYLSETNPTKKEASPFTKHLFHLIWADPGFWCQLGTFVVVGVIFRRFGFGDGAHNGVMLDVSTFTIGFYLRVTLAKHLSIYTPRELAGSALNYAHKNFPTRMVIVPFTSTFVPLLYGYPTASVENIAACWVQHFIALMASYWSLEPNIVNNRADLRARPYAAAARVVENLKVRVAGLGSFTDVSDGSLAGHGRLRAKRPRTRPPSPGVALRMRHPSQAPDALAHMGYTAERALETTQRFSLQESTQAGGTAAAFHAQTEEYAVSRPGVQPGHDI